MDLHKYFIIFLYFIHEHLMSHKKSTIWQFVYAGINSGIMHHGLAKLLCDRNFGEEQKYVHLLTMTQAPMGHQSGVTL